MAPHKEYRKPHKHKSPRNTNVWLILGIIAILIIIVGTFSALGQQSVFQNANATPTPTATLPSTPIPASADPYANSTKVLLHTSMGDITVELRNDMPITTGNFINLVKSRTYDNTIFHRVIAGFMIQGGDPTGTGYGDPSIPTIQDEITTTNHNYNGTIAMAKSSNGQTSLPNSAASQFFINVADNNQASFDSTYAAFGRVISGMNVVMAISKVQTNSSNDKPVQDVSLISATVLP
jgi:peptidylprolyl isomerase